VLTLIMTTYNRDVLLQRGLMSITSHPWLRILVVNDGVEGNAKAICERYGADYLFTDAANTWRVPGFALNIGVKNCASENIILSCAEIYHMNACCRILRDSCGDKTLAIPQGWDDDGTYVEHGTVNKLPILNTKLPFLMALRRNEYMDIGGYDEDFTGSAYDDDDIVGRLVDNGCEYVETDALCVHLYHGRNTENKRATGRHEYNKRLYEQRKGIIIRNEGKVWGELLRS